MSELEQKYEFDLPMELFNEYSYLKSYGYQIAIGSLIDKHLLKTDFELGKNLKSGVAWVVISISYEIHKPLKLHDYFYAQTWHVERKGPFFRRDFVFKNQENEILFQGATFTVLLDMETRTIYRKQELPFVVFPETKKATIIAHPSIKADYDYLFLETRKVANSFLDPLKHVNNCRYGEFTYDLLTPEELQKTSLIKRIDLFFHSELTMGEQFILGRFAKDHELYVEIKNLKTAKRAFTAKITW